MHLPEIFGLSAFPVFRVSQSFEVRNCSEKKQGFRTPENFAKLTENVTENKVRNPCPKIIEVSEISESLKKFENSDASGKNDPKIRSELL